MASKVLTMLARSVTLPLQMKTNIVRQHFQDLGKRGNAAQSVEVKRRCGHSTAAKMFRRMAVKARMAGDQAQAEDLLGRALEQERLAQAP